MNDIGNNQFKVVDSDSEIVVDSKYKVIIMNLKKNPTTTIELKFDHIDDIFTSEILELFKNVDF